MHDIDGLASAEAEKTSITLCTEFPVWITDARVSKTLGRILNQERAFLTTARLYLINVRGKAKKMYHDDGQSILVYPGCKVI